MGFDGEPVVLRPIGYVKTKAVGNEVKDKNLVSQVVLNKDLLEALDGLEEFSHVYIIFYLNKVSDRQNLPLKVHPRGRQDLPLQGVFATRTNQRPNPIGLTLVELLKIEGTVLTVRGLDAYDGSPVLDIKAYDYWDSAENAHVPQWRMQLEKEKHQKGG